jgi:hypothetical protein
MVKNQHYIPRSYLKNFGYLVNTYTRPNGHIDEKWSIHNIENGSDIKPNSTKKICTVDYLYDLPLVSPEFIQAIEKGYGERVDKHYKEVTKFVTNDNAMELSEDMRQKILLCTLSLYFRTPRYILPSDSELAEIEKLPKDIGVAEWNRIKTANLEAHIENFERLYEQKKSCGICINKVCGDWEFISGDNPLIIRSPNGQFEDVFSPHNIIHLPFTPKYCVTIIPESESKNIAGFSRYKYPNHHIMTINHDIEHHHEKYMFGTKEALQDYLIESPKYKEPTTSDHPMLVGMEESLKALNHCLEVMKKYGPTSTQHKALFMKYWNSIEMFREDCNNQDLKKQIGL